MIGGKVLDASALAALVRGRLSAVAWFATAKTTGLTLYLPVLALNEVRAVRPDAGPQLAEVLGHPPSCSASSTPPRPTRSTSYCSRLTSSMAAPDTLSTPHDAVDGQR
ncbi:MAG: hypothetical protein H0V41_14720 [Pseudonocardiales bacterium]|nr:hypothetical protein [Pseudonocardiales bacterium]